MTMNHYDVIVIGGGASGMMSAGIAASCGKRVLLLEKNKQLGEKLKISGGGRCNITNAEFDTRKFLAVYGDNEKFLYSPFSQFGVAETISFFEQLGLPIVVQEHNRAFPKSERAADVFAVLESFLKKNNVTVMTSSPVVKINTSENPLHDSGEGGLHSKPGEVVTSIVVGSKTYTANSFILATGGLSHPETGSTGDGFEWLRDLGHTVVAPTPSIVPIAVSNKWIKSVSGASFDDTTITFFCDKKKSFSKTGRILATHFGLSGPTILNSAKKIGDLLHEGPVTATINLFPKKDLGAVERLIIELFDANKNKSFKNIFPLLVPKGMSESIMNLVTGIDPNIKAHSITKESRKALVRLLMALPVTVTGLMGFDRAVVADGGIRLQEIDTKTMRSKIIKNLYITGDLLHVNRPSGGFSLQLCWTTGYVVGIHS
jgi:predicted Rossmann fold flavoprotein